MADEGKPNIPPQVENKVPPVEPPAEPPAEQLAESPAPIQDWRDKELAQKHRQLKERDQQMAEIRAENERLRQLAEAAARGAPETPSVRMEPPPAAPPVTDIEARARQLASEMMAREQATNLDVKLRSEYSGDYETIIKNFSSLEGSFEIMFNEIMATDDPAYVTAALGKNPAEIQRVRDLPPNKRQAALMKMAFVHQQEGEPKPKEPAPKRLSGAPPPPSNNPPGGGVQRVESDNLYDERYDFKNYYAGNDQIAVEKERDEAYYARRLEQKRNSVGRPWSLGNKAGTGGRSG